MKRMTHISGVHVDIAVFGSPRNSEFRAHYETLNEAERGVQDFIKTCRPMTRDTAPVGVVCTLGHPANKNLIVRTEHFGWRYLHNLNEVDPEDFRAGFEIYNPEEG